MADDLLKHEPIEELFRVQANLRNKKNHWLYGKRISSLLEQGLLVELKQDPKLSDQEKRA